MNLRVLVLLQAIVPTVFLTAACESNIEEQFALGEINKEISAEIRELIGNELRIGDSADTIEAFFQRHNIGYSYDRFSIRYQAIIRDVSPDPSVDQAIVIYVNVDNEKRFLSAEVTDNFTSF